MQYHYKYKYKLSYTEYNCIKSLKNKTNKYTVYINTHYRNLVKYV